MHKTDMRRRVVFLLLSGLLLLLNACDRQAGERVLGDYGAQPKTVVTPLAGGTTPDLKPIIDSAKRAGAGAMNNLWPEPARIVEQETRWDVWFDYRQKLVEVNGQRLVQSQRPGSLKIEVQKSDLSAKLIPGR